MTRPPKGADRPQVAKRLADPDNWHVRRIQAGLAAARAGRVIAANEVFARIAAMHGWR